MAEECTESSVATSASTPTWWDLHASALSSWNINPNSNSSCEEDVSISTSFTNASNHSGLSVDSSQELVGEPAASENHLWNHVLLNLGSNGDLTHSQHAEDNLSNGIFDPACDYLKKMSNNNNWEFTNLDNSLNSFQKHFTGYGNGLIETNKSSNPINYWSLAPPETQACNISVSGSSSIDQYSHPDDICDMKHSFTSSTSFHRTPPSLSSCYSHHLKVEIDHQDIEAPLALFRRSNSNNNNNTIGCQLGLINSSIVGDNSKYFHGIHKVPCNIARNFSDIDVSLSGSLTKPSVDSHASKPYFRSLNLTDCKKEGLQASSMTKSNGRGNGLSSEGKKKRSEDATETVLKKPKHENSTVSSTKVQVPKVKLGERITALQQIVSPFGKTDTASVLFEAIKYITFLQEQVQLLSNPYLKNNTSKDPWGGCLERKDHKGDAKFDLKARGLCLVPVSCTPQAYRDNAGSDYWTPTYRGCLYR